MVANAKAKVTANGNPSGMATTTIVTAVIIISINLLPLSAGSAPFILPLGAISTQNLMNKTTNKTMAARNPYLEIPSAKSFKRTCIGVLSGS